MEAYPLRLLRNLGRTREIVTVLLRHGFGDIVSRLGLPNFWQRVRRVIWRSSPPSPRVTTVERVRRSLEDLGPTYIKFGQVMSTRPDLIPASMIRELQKLQEHVPPFGSDEARLIVERELGTPCDALFRSFERAPLAAGSLAQVHRAVLPDGTLVAVKIRRPHAIRDVERDLSLMQELAALIERHIPESRVFDPVGLVRHFARTIRRELNFSREGRTMDEFRRQFKDDCTLHVPQVFFEYTTEAILTTEFVHGYRIDEYLALSSPPYAPSEIAVNGARIYMQQVMQYGYFHGDPHPGNLRIRNDGSICLLDYGMVGLLDNRTRSLLVDLLQAVHRKDAEAVIDVVIDLGDATRAIDDVLLQIDVQDFIGNYYGIEIDRLNVGQMLTDFVKLLGSHGLRCPANVLLLIRVLVALDGVGRQLDPRFNLAQHAQPFVEKLVRERYDPKQVAGKLARKTQRLMSVASDLPVQINRSLQKLNDDELQVNLDHRGLDHFMLELERSSNRLVVGMVVAAMILASAVVVPPEADRLWFSVPFYMLSSLLGIWLVYGIFRSGRL